MNNLCVIPARGGSERIKSKNIVEIQGKPLLSWVIDVAKESNLFSRIVVSTDSQEIADIAESSGIEVPFLRTDMYDNNTHVMEAVGFACKQIEAYWNEEYETLGVCFANAPFVETDDLIDCYKFFNRSRFNIIASVSKNIFSSAYHALILDKNSGAGEFLFPEETSKRTQDKKELHYHTGAFAFVDYKYFVETGDSTQDRGYYEVSWLSGLDIDTEEDLKLANILMNARINNLL